MADRIRRHMLVSIGGVFAAFVLMAVAGFTVRMIAGPTPPPWIMVIPALGIMTIPLIGFWSTYRNLRCPSCERLVVWDVSWNYSLFNGMANKTCRGCGKKIFGDVLRARFRRMFVIMFALGIGLGVLGAVANVVTSMQRHHQTSPP
jgi:hypothetical protein